MFGFGRKKNGLGTMQSWHYSASKGIMVRCASTPCRIHGNADVMAHDIIEATSKYMQQASAYQKTQQANMQANGGMGLQASNAKQQQPSLDPFTLRDVDYHRHPLFKNMANALIISMKPVKMGESEYVLSIDGLSSATPVLYFAKLCTDCHGSGMRTILDRDGNERMIDCIGCRKVGYARHLSCSPADAALIQPVNSNADRRWHDYVRAHPDAYNAYMRHVACADCYLADDGEKEFYGSETGRDVRQMCATDPKAAYDRMMSLQTQYDDWKRNNPQSVKGLGDMIMADTDMPIGQISLSDDVKCKIMKSKDMKPFSDGSPKTFVIMSDGNKGVGYKAFIKGWTSKQLPPGYYARVRKAYRNGYDEKYNNGEPTIMLRGCELG